MRQISGEEEKEAIRYMDEAAKVALESLCLRAKCGTVIVKDNGVIGRGYNAPPLNDITLRTCLSKYSLPENNKHDRTCCVHAEQRAITDALKTSVKSISGSRLYFIRLGEDDKITKAGKPYCTGCSKMALDEGIAEFVLWHDQGICVYDTREYNSISHQQTKT